MYATHLSVPALSTQAAASGTPQRRRTTMATTTQRTDVRETHSLIASDKVEGTPVYRSSGEQVGTIQRVMIDKLSGKVGYAVMSFGGFLGIGEDYYPLPWSVLKYNERLGGYEVNLTEQQLKGAPKFGQYESWDWNDGSRTRQLDTYCAMPGVV
jgi:sporulation protein YlmC with PRC-barrel domain